MIHPSHFLKSSFSSHLSEINNFMIRPSRICSTFQVVVCRFTHNIAHTNTHPSIHTFTCTHTRARIHVHTHTHTDTHAHTRMHIHARTRTLTHAHAQTHTYTQFLMVYYYPPPMTGPKAPGALPVIIHHKRRCI